MVWYGPNKGDGEERDMDIILDSVENGYRSCILGDLNGWIGDRTRAGITSAFGVPGENDNGRRVVEFWEEMGLCVGNTYFNHRSLHNYTKVARGRDGVQIKSMINLALVKRDVLQWVQDVRTERGMGRGLSDHHVVLCTFRLVGVWIKRTEVVVGTRRTRSEKLGLLRGRE